MVIGTLKCSFTTQEPPFHILYGPGSEIAGRVDYTFKPPKKHFDHMLYGPVTISLILEGNMYKSGSWPALGRTSFPQYAAVDPPFTNRLILSNMFEVYNGVIHAAPRQTLSKEFTIHFSARSFVGPSSENLVENPELLPPSFCHTFGRPSEPGFDFVEVKYTLRLQVEMPGIDIKIKISDPCELRYEQRRPQSIPRSSLRFQLQGNTKGRRIMPKGSRPNLFKAMLTSSDRCARFAFGLQCMNVPTHICTDARITFDLVLTPEMDQSNIDNVPLIQLHSCCLTLSAAHAALSGRLPHPVTSHAELCQIPAYSRDGSAFCVASAYRKRMCSAGRARQTTSFNTDGLRCAYHLQIELVLLVEDKKHKLSTAPFRIILIPPLLPRPDDADELPDEAPLEPLPRYEEDAAGLGIV